MKNKKLILKTINSKFHFTYFFLGVISFLFLSMIIGNSFALRENQLDLNGNKVLEVGDVVKLRSFLVNDEEKYTIKIIAENAKIYNSEYIESDTEIINENSRAIFLVIPNNPNKFVTNVRCTNGQIATTYLNKITLNNVSGDTVCTANIGSYSIPLNTGTYADYGLKDFLLSIPFNNAILNEIATSSNLSIKATAYFDHIISSYYFGEGTSCGTYITATNRAVIENNIQKNGTYILCTKDENNIEKSFTFNINNFDEEGPTITDTSNKNQECKNYYAFIANIKDDKSGIVATSFTTDSNIENVTWNNLNNTIYNFDYKNNIGTKGTYYLFAKDAVGNTSSIEIVVDKLCLSNTETYIPVYYVPLYAKNYLNQKQVAYYYPQYIPSEIKNIKLEQGNVSYSIDKNERAIIFTFNGAKLQNYNESALYQDRGRYLYYMEFSDPESLTAAIDVTTNVNGTLTHNYTCDTGELTDDNQCVVCPKDYYYNSFKLIYDSPIYYKNNYFYPYPKQRIQRNICEKEIDIDQGYFYYIDSLTYSYNEEDQVNS